MCELCELGRRQDTQDVISVIDVDGGATDLADLHVGIEADIINHRLPQQAPNTLAYDALVVADDNNIVENTQPFECAICLENINAGHGIVLHDCLHMFCRTCLADYIGHSEDAEVGCPFDSGYKCHSPLQDREIHALVTEDVYEKYLRLGLREAERRDAHSYHCVTADCPGWCTYDDDVNTFPCYVCGRHNCITCRAIHDGQNCQEYQQELQANLNNTKLENMVKTGEAMKCPTCQVIITKKEGCDWIMCTICKTEICWVTKQARWGPNGNGDVSGGCRCGINGRRCHPLCGNCH